MSEEAFDLLLVFLMTIIAPHLLITMVAMKDNKTIFCEVLKHVFLRRKGVALEWGWVLPTLTINLFVLTSLAAWTLGLIHAFFWGTTIIKLIAVANLITLLISTIMHIVMLIIECHDIYEKWSFLKR